MPTCSPRGAGARSGSATMTDTADTELQQHPEFRRLFTGQIRTAICPECQRPFTQYQLSLFLYEWARTLAEEAGPVRQTELERELPDGYVPRLCDRCEREDLARGTT